jgi:hypothetical protein
MEGEQIVPYSVVNVGTDDQTFLSASNTVTDSDKVTGNNLFIVGRHVDK